ncbi:MAG: mandelate racemase/muconate lactonizing enzyme family protein, partial [Armatimonadetes bacterium]|nr:mandelate racemase/muconate lactonizing enzyme family protein [Armatimonadota bacterium]
MTISNVQVYQLVRIRRQYPTVISKQIHADGIRPVEESLFVLFEVVTDTGLRGIGEVSDLEPDAVPDLPALQEALRRALIGRSPYEVATIQTLLPEHAAAGAPLGTGLYRCAVDMALHDLQGKAAGAPIYQLLGGARRDAIRISAVVYIRDASLVSEEVRERREQGFRDFKLKVGLGLEQDEASLAALREAAGPEAHVKIDPNGAWDVDEAIRCLRRLEKYNVAGVETPIPAPDLEGKLALKKEITIPILEHVSTPEFALACAKTGAVDVFNLSLCGCGGLYRAGKVAAVAEAAGIRCLLGSTLELWPGTAAQAHFGASVGPLEFPSDLVGPLMYQSDV